MNPGPADSDPERQQRLLPHLLQGGFWPDGEAPAEHIETHSAHLFLFPRRAYKLKKSLNLGFLDFSNLARRRHCCEEEIRLNRRLAPEIYLGVVPVTGSPDAPRFGGDPAGAIEWLVEMRRFEGGDVLAERPDLLDEALVDQLAAQIARFHREAAVCPADQAYGSPKAVLEPMRQNFTQIRERVSDPAVGARLQLLADWTEARFAELEPLLAARKAGGFIRECHGDLHLGNIALHRGRPLIFDGIEFNPDLRWIDLCGDLAFLLMDLEERGRPELATRLLNGYLEIGGDFAGVPLLTFYKVYRAMVRAKVAAIRWQQLGGDDPVVWQSLLDYLDFARRLTLSVPPCLFITCGLSGSGKTWLGRELAARWPAIHLRSDVERKRLLGRPHDARTDETDKAQVYGPEMGRRTYARLAELAGQLLDAGQSVLVDATFMQAGQRAVFRELAAARGVAFRILWFDPPEAVLRARVQARTAQGQDASEADLSVLEAQLDRLEPPQGEELESSLHIIEANPELEPLLAGLHADLAG